MEIETIGVNELNESRIIKENEIPTLIKWLPEHPIKKIKKLYDTKKDAPNAGSFHQKYDNKGDTIVLAIKTSSGNRFGWYTKASWGRGHGLLVFDDTAFLFSLDLNKKYLVNTPNFAIYCHLHMAQHSEKVMIYIYLIIVMKMKKVI